MEDEKKEEKQADDSRKDNNTNDDNPTAIEVAEKLHKQIKEENDRHETLLTREENLKAEQMLGGQAEAGEKAEPISEEQKIKDRCNEQLKGTGLSI